MPEISIIVPVYNAENSLERCIESIVNQSFTNYELILVDDGSSDRSLIICQEYVDMDSRIKVVHQENRGVSAARNKGITESLGKYIMFCDSDDYVDREWCETLYSAIKENNNAWIVSNAYRVTKAGKKIISEKLNTSTFMRGGYEQVYKIGLSAYGWNKIYNREILLKHQVVLEEKCSLGEDVLFNLDYYKWCDKTVYISTPLYFYCDNEEGLMHRYRNNLFEDNCKLFNARLPYISDEGMNSFCDQYLYYFMQYLENTWDKKNKSNFLQKLHYNNRLMNREEFLYCLKYATGEKESALYMRIIRLHNYYVYWVFMKLIMLKHHH